ncbi:uncharacterized protein VTP21DRAFT_1266 [Calcarisporiella thermophila]|uniref:uncharacterized protein n=1 Tax=Calcarisporiella thermophila TaxID=911321 RepID=UPI0037430E71
MNRNAEVRDSISSSIFQSGHTALDLGNTTSDEKIETKIQLQPDKISFKVILLISISLCIVVFLAALDQTIVTTALPRIASEFNSLGLYSWVGTAFQITFTAFQPLYGRLSDIFGRKPIIMFLIIVFLIGSALCGASNSMVMLIVFRAVQGIGGGGLWALALIIIADIAAPEDQGKLQGIIGAAFTIASIIGPLIGGVFTDKVTWRWCFYINLPIGAVALLMIFFTVRIPMPKGSILSKIKRIDFLGSIVVIAITVCLLLAISFGGNEFSWNSAVVIVLFCVGVLLIGIFVLVEGKFAIDPVLPMRLFKNLDFGLLSLSNFFFGIGFFIGFFYYTYYFQILGASATDAGIRFLPMSLVLIVVNISVGFAVSYLKKVRPFIWVGFAILLVGAGLTTTFSVSTSASMQMGYTVIVGAGMGFIVQTLLLAMQIAVDPSEGMSFGIAIGGALLNNQLSTGLSKIPGVSVELAKNNLSYVKKLPPQTRIRVLRVFVGALQWVFRSALISFGIAGVLVLFIKYRPLSKEALEAPMEM